MEDTINIPMGICTRHVTKEEIKKAFNDLDFLEQAILCLIDNRHYENWDNVYFDSKEELKEKVQEYFLENCGGFGYSKDFINDVFKKGN